MALHAGRWLAGSGFRVPGLAVCQLALPIGFAVLTVFIEELCGMLVHLGPEGPSESSTARITPPGLCRQAARTRRLRAARGIHR